MGPPYLLVNLPASRLTHLKTSIVWEGAGWQGSVHHTQVGPPGY